MSKGPKSFPYLVLITALIMLGAAVWGEYVNYKHRKNNITRGCDER